jgi:hypothetical protein
MNVMKTTLLLGLLSGLLIFGGVVIAGERGLVYGLVMAVAMNFFSCFFSEKMALMSAREGNVVRQRAEEDWAPEPQPDWRLADDLSGADGSRVDTNGNFPYTRVQRGRDICPRIGNRAADDQRVREARLTRKQRLRARCPKCTSWSHSLGQHSSNSFQRTPPLKSGLPRCVLWGDGRWRSQSQHSKPLAASKDANPQKISRP